MKTMKVSGADLCADPFLHDSSLIKPSSVTVNLLSTECLKILHKMEPYRQEESHKGSVGLLSLSLPGEQNWVEEMEADFHCIPGLSFGHVQHLSPPDPLVALKRGFGRLPIFLSW